MVRGRGGTVFPVSKTSDAETYGYFPSFSSTSGYAARPSAQSCKKMYEPLACTASTIYPSHKASIGKPKEDSKEEKEGKNKKNAKGRRLKRK
jgi:hypothetical protein